MRESLEKKSTMRKLTYDNYITGAFLILLGITLAFNIFFQDGNKLFRIILTAVAVIIMKSCIYNIISKKI